MRLFLHQGGKEEATHDFSNPKVPQLVNPILPGSREDHSRQYCSTEKDCFPVREKITRELLGHQVVCCAIKMLVNTGTFKAS